mgnify:CR=1 FL=1
MHPKDLKIADYTYQLPQEKIAQYPLENRDASKLLIFKNNTISESVFRSITEHVPANSLMVFNNSKVIEARLLFKKQTGGKIEIFTLEPSDAYKDITEAMLQKEAIVYKCLVGGASKWKNEEVLQLMTADNTICLYAKKLEQLADGYLIEFSWSQPELTFAEILHLAGNLPIPPYLQRSAETEDATRYQTVYAEKDGSVAAPTAGLHFTKEVLAELDSKNIATTYTTLHVGAGTFMPVKSEQMQDHIMHAEYIEITDELLTRLAGYDFITAVGTTSTRTLESIYWMGVKTLLNPGISYNDLMILQWDPYNADYINAGVSKKDAVESLKKWMVLNERQHLIIKTQIIIAPGYTFRVIDALVTNFHQPQSTLLLLVSALIGNQWRTVYEYALNNNFRFLSYGDSSILFKS